MIINFGCAISLKTDGGRIFSKQVTIKQYSILNGMTDTIVYFIINK